MAESIDFTIRNIEAIKAPESGRLEFKDTKEPGLYLRVTSTGVKTFSFVGRPKGSSRVERLTFGKFPAVKPDEARRRAREIAGQLAGGQSMAQAQRSKRGELTLSELFTEYLARLKVTAKRPDIAESVWRLHLEPAFGKRKLSEISHLDVGKWHRGLPAEIVKRREDARKERDALRETPSPTAPACNAAPSARTIDGKRAANQALGQLHAMFRWATDQARIYSGPNPAQGIEKFKEVSRDRFLQPDELAPFFQALAEEPSQVMRDFFLVALLTGARRSNVLAMRWVDVNLERAEWRIPETKNGEPQTVTLTPEAVQILAARMATRDALPREGRSAFAFPSDRVEDDAPITSPKGAWKRVLERAGLSNLRIHDLRRTLGSWQARTGASLVIVGKSLNHKSQDSTRIYAQLDLDPVRQSVDRATSAMFEAAGVKSGAQVLALPSSDAKAAKKSNTRRSA